jgi:hypothetical protein
MPLWTTSAEVFNDTTSDTVRSKAFNIPVQWKGLKPSTKYKFYLDGVELGFAVKPFGKKLGDDLISGADGTLSFSVLYDFQFEGNYAFDNLPTTPVTGAQYNQQSSDTPYYFTTQRFFELKGVGGAYASGYFPLRLLITPAHVNRLESHAH